MRSTSPWFATRNSIALARAFTETLCDCQQRPHDINLATSKTWAVKAEVVKGMCQVSLIFACGTALFSDGYANGLVGALNLLLMTVYPD
ncbi:hypothetical protein DACRYDRAFT_109089 [Dacryopinax primogenitus]|uniref:Uncharacterized protein n=1 Tax=Dacryopinax primogenitus (strain DJM 731) TaxID=1858805 RepID=M5G986_DACPD|nr:uncharacterized protein DACRYDRAFT_109089 [Dacryopinax primogenitus]EJU00353.1 hypothetical protein DACRYDRAFT_109089 [Dacryopinax primogenitus]